ncbi:conjugative transposon protein TraM [Sunxiuqinia indica]|uniref:conjugative transposon protein TraM n=1 Tax=Sunxiuqinia indica TaxID=2692584 RepID=UPI00135CF155|nr:conjugative transposon protein TraM [Sunxiuqinia indica]
MKAILKRNKPLLFLPLVLIPFIVLLFYILGGGKNPTGKSQNRESQDTIRGANFNLPEADRSIEIIDKTDAAVSQDEITLSHDYNILGEGEESKSDTAELGPTLAETSEEEMANSEPSGISPESNTTDPIQLLKHIQQRQKQIRGELETGKAVKSEPHSKALNAEQNRKTEQVLKATSREKQPEPNIPVTGIEELDRVFRQNASLSKQNDSLSNQLIQAQSILQKQEEERNKKAVLEKAGQSVFKPKEQTASILKAEVYETATVLTGNRVKLRLLEDGWLGSEKIPKGTFLYGTCEVANERLKISIRQVQVVDNFIPVEITVYDLDGLVGLYVPDNAARKVAKEVGSSTNTSSMFAVTGNPLTYAGIQAADRTAQSLLRLVRIKKVTVKKNTLVYLVNKPK